MVTHNRLDNVEIIAHLLADINTSVSGLNTRELRLDLKKIKARSRTEGSAFFTKTLPTLGKAIDMALLGQSSFDQLRLCKQSGSKLPKLFGELLKRVFSPDGMVLKEPCIKSIRALRDLTFVFYKYEIPYAQTQSEAVIAAFEDAERDLDDLNLRLLETASAVFDSSDTYSDRKSDKSHSLRKTLNPRYEDSDLTKLVRAMRKEAFKLFSSLDLNDIWPKHGPGAVATRESGVDKYLFTRYSSKLDSVYPYTKYFVPCEGWIESPSYLDQLSQDVPSARVLLVPKDSRGPRLISCEPLENQWIQQGIKSLLVKYIEEHPVMGGHVNFTDQSINQRLALQGSIDGSYATLDLKEASDRISNTLVQLIFPYHMVRCMSVCRTNCTQLPDGRVISLSKFAPMGSALCFPILASVVWLALTAGSDACCRKTTYVYGDDIIVQGADVPNAIKRLELIGLLVNKHKSCFTGFFRESCGMDAYLGEPITPFRFRKVWSHRPQADLYVSYVEKSNIAYNRGYSRLANYIARKLAVVYGSVPYNTCELTEYDALSGAPHLTFIPDTSDKQLDMILPQGRFMFDRKSWICRPLRRKPCKKTHRQLTLVSLVQAVTAVSNKEENNYFRKLSTRVDVSSNSCLSPTWRRFSRSPSLDIFVEETMRAAVYTHDRASKLVRKWR